MKSPISSVFTRFTRLSRTFCSCPARTWTTYHCFRFCSSVMIRCGGLLDWRLEQSAHQKVQQKIPARDVAAHEEHGDHDDRGRIGQFLVFLRAFPLRIPWP